MTKAAKEIVKAAVRLPERDRIELVEELLVSLESKADENIDAAWAAEIEKRSRELKEGSVRPIPWHEVRSRTRKRAGGGS